MNSKVKKNPTEIFGIKMTNMTYQALLDSIMAGFFRKEKRFVSTPNPEILTNSLKYKEYHDVLEKADFSVPDGIGLFLAFQILEYKNIFIRIFLLPYFTFNILFRKEYLFEKYGEKICGSDLTLSLINKAIEHNIKIGIIDPKQIWDDDYSKQKKHIQDNIDEILGAKFPKLDFSLIIYDGDDQKLYDTIKKEKIQIGFSTIGMKKQEIQCYNIIKNTDCLLTLGIGASFDYHTGFQQRAPEKIRTSGFEWFYRLKNPGRWKRIKRIYNAIFVFTFNVIFFRKKKSK